MLDLVWKLFSVFTLYIVSWCTLLQKLFTRAACSFAIIQPLLLCTLKWFPSMLHNFLLWMWWGVSVSCCNGSWWTRYINIIKSCYHFYFINTLCSVWMVCLYYGSSFAHERVCTKLCTANRLLFFNFFYGGHTLISRTTPSWLKVFTHMNKQLI